VRFYEKNGFILLDKIPNSEWYWCVSMEKQL
jgi:hypothetical protein